MTERAKSSARTVPMRVLVLGFCRTGTAYEFDSAMPAAAVYSLGTRLAMHSALRIVGYNDTHHMNTVIQNPSEIDAWTAAINAKFYGRGKPYDRAERDALLGNFQAVTDTPSVIFAEDLIAAYPEAKVILTIRDPDRCRAARIRVRAEDEAKARFVAHYDKVRGGLVGEAARISRGRGWERLCSFLGDNVPEVDFPRTNDTKMIRTRAQTASARVFRGVVWGGTSGTLRGIGLRGYVYAKGTCIVIAIICDIFRLFGRT
ncbi:hypothetical protein B0H13DRAFT_2425600 [Mycena leptocephala]|nr:hypothetical protein B0H13DRAFT_2425600 [Mycena leptocephala]